MSYLSYIEVAKIVTGWCLEIARLNVFLLLGIPIASMLKRVR